VARADPQLRSGGRAHGGGVVVTSRDTQMADDVDKATDNALDAARDFAWKHFDLHAKQRIEVFKAYLTLTALVFAGYGVLIQAKIFGLGVFLSLFWICISIFFLHLDRRTRDLIKLSEDYFKDEELRLARIINNQKIALFAESDRLTQASTMRGRTISYGRIFLEFFWSNIILALMLLAYLFYKTTQS
jgi:hypothetical protein